VHIHFGTCGPNLGRVRFSLSDVVKGQSTTLVPEPLNVFTDGNHAINLHKSYAEMSIYNACGNIPVQ